MKTSLFRFWAWLVGGGLVLGASLGAASCSGDELSGTSSGTTTGTTTGTPSGTSPDPEPLSVLLLDRDGLPYEGAQVTLVTETGAEEAVADAEGLATIEAYDPSTAASLIGHADGYFEAYHAAFLADEIERYGEPLRIWVARPTSLLERVTLEVTVTGAQGNFVVITIPASGSRAIPADGTVSFDVPPGEPFELVALDLSVEQQGLDVVGAAHMAFRAEQPAMDADGAAVVDFAQGMPPTIVSGSFSKPGSAPLAQQSFGQVSVMAVEGTAISQIGLTFQMSQGADGKSFDYELAWVPVDSPMAVLYSVGDDENEMQVYVDGPPEGGAAEVDWVGIPQVDVENSAVPQPWQEPPALSFPAGDDTPNATVAIVRGLDNKLHGKVWVLASEGEMRLPDLPDDLMAPLLPGPLTIRTYACGGRLMDTPLCRRWARGLRDYLVVP